MTLLNITHPADFDSGGEMKADHWNDPLEKIETLLQSDVHGENFQPSSLRGRSFRKRGLTEVFQRKAEVDPWVCWPGNDSRTADVPGGALRFRLRAPAAVMVFFSALIHRHNRRDMSLSRHDLKRTRDERHPEVLDVAADLEFYALWEGGDAEPGDEYVQASTILKLESYQGYRPNMSKGVFLPWKIRPMDGMDYKDLSEVRMFDQSMAPSVGLPAPGLLQAGWHNIRHTVYMVDPRSDGMLNGNTGPVLVFGGTELIVVADYGPTTWAGDIATVAPDDSLRGRVFPGPRESLDFDPPSS